MGFRRSNLGFFLMQGTFWATYCTIFGFTVTILRSYGFSAEVCGLVTTLQCVVIMLVQPFYGHLIDHLTTPKRGMIGVVALGILFSIPLPWIFKQSAWIVVAYLTFLSVFIYSGGAIADAWTVAVINRTRGMDYAVTRGGGSVMYAFVALLAGNLIAPFGVESLFVLHIILGVITIGIAAVLVDSTKLEDALPMPDSPVREKVSFVKSVKVLLSSRQYLLFTACVCLYNFGTRAYSTYFPMVLESVGGTSAHFGIGLFISSFGELFFMLLASWIMLRGVPASYVYLSALAILAFRFVLMGVIDNLWLMLATNVIQAVGFGFQLRINAEYLVSTAPPGYEGMAIMLSGAISNGVGCVLGNYVGGILVSSWGVKPYVLLCAGFLAAAFLLFLPTGLREHRHRVEQKNEYWQMMRERQIQNEKEPS